MSASRRSQAALGVVIIVGAALRLAGLGAPSLWLDEAHSARVAVQAWPDLLALARTYFGGLLYYAQLHLWTAALGHSEFALRLPSAIASLLAIPLLYQLARRVAPGSAAFVAALLLALAPLDVWYAQEARMYALATCLSVLCAYAALRYRQTGQATWVLCYALSGLAGLYTLYSFLLVLLAINALGFLERWASQAGPRGREAGAYAARWPVWLGAHVFMAAGFAPWLPVLREHLRLLAADAGRWQAWAALTRLLPGAGLRWAMLAALAVAGLLGALLLWRKRKWLFGLRRLTARSWAGWLGGFLPYLLLAVLAAWRPISSIRQATILMPFVCLAAALALARLGRRGTPVLASLLLIFVIALGYARVTVQKEQWREAAAWIAQEEQAGDAILLHAYYVEPAFAYYYAGQAPVGRISRPGNDALLQQAAQGYDRIWLVLSHDVYEDPRRLAEGWFEAHAVLAEERALAGIRVRLYRTR